MDSKKLKLISTDIINEENKFNYTSLIKKLVATLNQSMTPNNNLVSQLKTEVEEIKNSFLNSITNEYSDSNRKILEQLNFKEMTGEPAFKRIDAILNESQYNIQDTINKLTEYNSERGKIIAQIKNLKNSFDFFNISGDMYNDLDEFEVGILFPDNLNNLKQLKQEFDNWDFIFSHFNEITGNRGVKSEIKLVNNGCLEFFFLYPKETVQCINLAIHGILMIFKKFKEIEEALSTLKKLGRPEIPEKNIKENTDEIIEKKFDELGIEIFKSFWKNEDDTRKSELQIAALKSLKKIHSSLKRGVSIEITPPRIEAPDDINEDDDEELKKKKKSELTIYEKTIKGIDTIKKTSKLISNLKEAGESVIDLIDHDSE